MTSFLNKKTNIILIILATLIIATTISSVAADLGTISFGNDDPTLIKNVTYNQTITVNGSFAGDLDLVYLSTLGETPRANSRIVLFAWDGASKTVVLKNSSVTVGAWDSVANWSYNVNTADLTNLGTWSIFAVYYHDYTLSTAWALNVWQGSTFTYPDSTNCPGYEASAGLASNPLQLVLKGKVIVTPLSTPAGLKVGQKDVSFTGYVKGTNASNLAGPMIGLPDVQLDIGYVDETNTWVSLNNTIKTDVNGSFTYPHQLVLNPKFTLVVKTLMDVSLIGNYPSWFDLIPLGLVLPTQFYSAWFEENVNGTDAFTAGPGTINITNLWFDSPNGYIVGDNATVFWNLDGQGDLKNQNIWAYLVLYNTNNNKQLRQRIVVNLTEDQSGLNISTGSFILSPWLKTHQNITVKLVIEGLLVPDADRYYTVSSNSNSTFVDKDDFSRRTTLRFADPTQLKNLRVGETCLITFDVLDYTGAKSNFTGQIKVTWDTTFSALVDVVNGVGLYYHTYLKAGTNRTITAQFLGDVANNASASVILREITDVLKGNATIGFNHDPYAHTGFVGVQSLFDIFVAKIVVDSKYAPKEINVRFVNSANNKTVLSRNLALTADLLNSTMAFAEYAHVYLKLYNPSPLVVYLSIKGNDNYVDSTTLAYNILVANP